MSADSNQVKVTFTVNGKELSVEVEPRETLLDTLRDKLGFTGAKKGCDEAVCGACTILLNGKGICSCMIFAVEAEGCDILTVEGLVGSDGTPDPVQKAFIESDAQQCGFCTSGQIMSTKALLMNSEKRGELNESSIKEGLSGNLCRCGAYLRILEAVKTAAKAEGLKVHD